MEATLILFGLTMSGVALATQYLTRRRAKAQ